MRNRLDPDQINALPMDYKIRWFTDYHCRIKAKGVEIDLWPTSCKMMVKSSNKVVEFEKQDFVETLENIIKKWS